MRIIEKVFILILATVTTGVSQRALAQEVETMVGPNATNASPQSLDEQDGQIHYRVGVTPGFPPFTNVDDPGVPGCHNVEANIYAQGDDSQNKKTTDLPYVELAYGLCSAKIEVKLEGWYQLDQDSGQPARSGLGDEIAGVKWLFLDGDTSGLKGALKGVSAAIYPQIQFAPSENSVKQGIVGGGEIYILPLLVTKEFSIDGRPFGLTMNIGYNEGEGGEPDATNEGVALGTAVSANTSVMISKGYSQFRSAQPNQRSTEFGVVHVPKKFKNLSTFAMVGRTGDNHWVWALGFQKIFHTGSEKSGEQLFQARDLKH